MFQMKRKLGEEEDGKGEEAKEKPFTESDSSGHFAVKIIIISVVLIYSAG